METWEWVVEVKGRILRIEEVNEQRGHRAKLSEY